MLIESHNDLLVVNVTYTEDTYRDGYLDEALSTAAVTSDNATGERRRAIQRHLAR